MRATVVIGIPSWVVRSSSWRVAVWTRIPLRLRLSFGVVTSILVSARAEVPVGGCGAVAEDRVGSVGEDRGHSVALARELSAADRVDPAVDAVQAAGLRSVADVVVGQPERDQLPGCDHPVLLVRQLGDQPVDHGIRTTFWAIVAGFVVRIEVKSLWRPRIHPVCPARHYGDPCPSRSYWDPRTPPRPERYSAASPPPRNAERSWLCPPPSTPTTSLASSRSTAPSSARSSPSTGWRARSPTAPATPPGG